VRIFWGANFPGANFPGANFPGANMYGVRIFRVRIFRTPAEIIQTKIPYNFADKNIKKSGFLRYEIDHIV
jgi:uncharacterized protein YjbI with pentapeptide repeats